jgi:tRNA threonylcarbamoyladenosine biosynthesis protein TsaB
LAENLTAIAKSYPSERSQRFCGLLAIETSGSTGSVAWTLGDGSSRLIELDAERRTAVTLSVAIAELLADARSQNESIDVVAVAVGPGSFTGLRIGVTAAKMLAYALDSRLVAVDSLAAMAVALWRLDSDADAALVAMNAYRQQLFVARWSRSELAAAVEQNTLGIRAQLWSIAAWCDEVARSAAGVTAGSVTLAGERSLAECSLDAADPYAAPITAVCPSALEVAELGRQLAAHGHFLSPFELRPNYLRDSAAEEKLR